MADTAITWRGLAIGGGGPLHVESITGWDDYPDITDLSDPRTRGHGDHVGDLYSRARIVTVQGSIASPTDRDALAQSLTAATALRSDVEPLTVETFGQALTAGARLIRRSLPVGDDYAAGVAPFALQWRCPDPLRYGAERTIVTGLPVTSGGLTYPLVYPLDYGTQGSFGQITLANEGTADTPIVFDVTGPLQFGFSLSAGPMQIVYAAEVAAGQVVTIDTGAGSVLVENTADRRGNVVAADWMLVPAGSSITVQFTSLGGITDPAATLRATYTPAFW